MSRYIITPERTVTIPETYTDIDSGEIFQVLHDPDAPDPRLDWDESEVSLYVLRNSDWYERGDPDVPENPPTIAMARYINRYDERTALKLTERYTRMFYPDWDVATRIIRGYGGWAAVFAASNGYDLEPLFEEFTMYFRGDVWSVHLLDSEDGEIESLHGIFASTPEDAIEQFRNY